jgi:hypothetical protein
MNEPNQSNAEPATECKPQEAEAKPLWKSKTLWLNLLTLVGMAINSYFANPSNTNGVEFLSASDQVGILAAVNIILRLITNQPLNVSNGLTR